MGPQLWRTSSPWAGIQPFCSPLSCHLGPPCRGPSLCHSKPTCPLPHPPVPCHTHLPPATPSCPLSHSPVSLTLPTPQLAQTSPPSPTSPLPTTSLLLSCFEPHLFSTLPSPPSRAWPACPSRAPRHPHRGRGSWRTGSLGRRSQGKGQARGAGTYRSQGAPSPRCCHRAWCARSGPRAGPGARCGAPMKICCWGSRIPPARCRSSCAGRGPAGPEPGWLQRTSLGDEVTAGKREAVASPTQQMKAKGGVIQPDPVISPQSHPPRAIPSPPEPS